MTSARRHLLTCGSRVSVPLTCGARSTVNIDRSTVNQVGPQLGFGGPGYGLDLGRAGSDMWQAMALPHRSHGPPLGFVHHSAHTAWLTVNSCSRSMDRWLVFGGPSPPFFLLAWFMCTGCRRVWPARKDSSASLPGMFPSVACSPVSFHSGVGVQLRWGKASSGLDDYDGGV